MDDFKLDESFLKSKDNYARVYSEMMNLRHMIDSDVRSPLQSLLESAVLQDKYLEFEQSVLETLEVIENDIELLKSKTSQI